MSIFYKLFIKFGIIENIPKKSAFLSRFSLGKFILDNKVFLGSDYVFDKEKNKEFLVFKSGEKFYFNELIVPRHLYTLDRLFYSKFNDVLTDLAEKIRIVSEKDMKLFVETYISVSFDKNSALFGMVQDFDSGYLNFISEKYKLSMDDVRFVKFHKIIESGELFKKNADRTQIRTRRRFLRRLRIRQNLKKKLNSIDVFMEYFHDSFSKTDKYNLMFTEISKKYSIEFIKKVDIEKISKFFNILIDKIITIETRRNNNFKESHRYLDVYASFPLKLQQRIFNYSLSNDIDFNTDKLIVSDPDRCVKYYLNSIDDNIDFIVKLIKDNSITEIKIDKNIIFHNAFEKLSEIHHRLEKTGFSYNYDDIIDDMITRRRGSSGLYDIIYFKLHLGKIYPLCYDDDKLDDHRRNNPDLYRIFKEDTVKKTH